jgi:hypothetical protein
MTQENQEVTGLLMRGEEQKVLADITITPQGIKIFQKEVQCYKYDNERLMKSKE